MAPASCAGWSVTDRIATGDLSLWCQHFGPCPQNLQQGIVKTSRFDARVATRGGFRVLRRGFLGGSELTFELDRFVGAKVWDDVSFGPCAKQSVATYVGGVASVAADDDAACGVVPGRDYTSGALCRCDVKARKPTLVNGNQGPVLRTSLECLYELGVAGYLCRPTLLEQRQYVASLDSFLRRPSERAECNGAVITSTFQGASASCRYDAAGLLVGLRWGKRYVSEGFTGCASGRTHGSLVEH